MLTSMQLGTLNLREGWGGKFWLPKALDEAVVANAHGYDDELCKVMLKVIIDNPKE